MFETKSYFFDDNPSEFITEYTKFWDALVPLSGKCETVEGELLRAATRINYDYYNNGFGNNWSNSYAYLRDFKKNYPEIAGAMNTGNALSVLRPYKNGRMMTTNMNTPQDKKIQESILRLMDECVKVVMQQNNTYHSNTVDSIEYARLPDDDIKTRNARDNNRKRSGLRF